VDKNSWTCIQEGITILSNHPGYFSLLNFSLGLFQNLPQILVPQGAYKFVAAMDEVIRQLPVEEPTHKGLNKLGLGNTHCIELILLMELYITFLFEEGDEKLLVLATQIVAGGRHYDFKLSAWHQMTGDKCHFDIRSVPTSEKHKEQQVHFPLWALPWLRQQMVTNLAEHDGSERIDEMPTMPEWAKQGFSHSRFHQITLSFIN
jgi:hypothetical protein